MNEADRGLEEGSVTLPLSQERRKVAGVAAAQLLLCMLFPHLLPLQLICLTLLYILETTPPTPTRRALTPSPLLSHPTTNHRLHFLLILTIFIQLTFALASARRGMIWVVVKAVVVVGWAGVGVLCAGGVVAGVSGLGVGEVGRPVQSGYFYRKVAVS